MLERKRRNDLKSSFQVGTITCVCVCVCVCCVTESVLISGWGVLFGGEVSCFQGAVADDQLGSHG